MPKYGNFIGKSAFFSLYWIRITINPSPNPNPSPNHSPNTDFLDVVTVSSLVMMVGLNL